MVWEEIMADARDELDIANRQLKAAEAFIDSMTRPGVRAANEAAALFLQWLRGARAERAAAIRDALDGEPVCDCCGNRLSCRACEWGS